MNRPARPASDRPVPPPAATPEPHDEHALDEALRESFPASDPVAVDVRPTPRPAAADRRA